MAQLFANNAYGVLAGTVNGAATLLVLVSGQGARFPAPTGGDHFLATLVGLDGNGAESVWEIVKCTGRSTDQLTVVRAQEGTTATTWNAGTRIEVRWTKEGINGKETVGVAAAAVATHVGLADPHTQYATKASPTFTGTVSGITKAMVGLPNADDTSDAAKPISTAAQTALNAKAPLTGAGTSGTWPISITGNAATATKLNTARAINGVNFNGTANIAVQVSWTGGITGKPAVIAEGATQAEARAAIGAGTSSLTLGISAGTALAGDTVVLPEAPSDGKTYGRKDAAWAEVVSGGGSGYATGDVITTARTLSPPDFLQADAVYLQSSYPSLYDLIGLIGNAGAEKVKMANPATLPTGAGKGCAWDASGTYLAIAHLTSPYVTIYERTGSTLTKLANPATLPMGVGLGCAWSPNSEFLAVTHATSPYVTVYQRSGSTFTKLSDPATLPTGTGNGCSWDGTNTYLAVAHETTPFMTVYQRSGTTLTKLSNPTTLPAGIGWGCAWDVSGEFLAVAHETTPFISIYQRSGATLTKLANPATLPTGAGKGCAWDASGSHLAVAYSVDPFLTVYQRFGATFTKLDTPAVKPTDPGTGCAWDASGTYLAVTHATSPYVTVYKRGIGTLSKLANPSVLPVGVAYGCSWGRDSSLAVAQSSSPYLTVYSSYGYDETTQFRTPSGPAVAMPLKNYIKA